MLLLSHHRSFRQSHSADCQSISRGPACEISQGVVVQMVQVGLALQLYSRAQCGHWAAAEAFCHAAEVAAQLQHLLHLPHLHLIVGFRPEAHGDRPKVQTS